MSKRRRLRGMVRVPRDDELLKTLWEVRQATRVQLAAHHFVDGHGRALSPSIALHRLKRLTDNGFLTTRPVPRAAPTGRPPLLYALGPAAAPIIAARCGLDLDVVRHRIRADGRLSWMFYEHRAAVTDVRLALVRACRRETHTLVWVSEEELARCSDEVELADGTRAPIRPDGLSILERREGGHGAAVVELERTSRPAAYRGKVRAYLAWVESGRWTASSGFRALRVLGIAESHERALSLKRAAEHVGGGRMFWSAALAAVAADPLGRVWSVAGETGMRSLLADD